MKILGITVGGGGATDVTTTSFVSSILLDMQSGRNYGSVSVTDNAAITFDSTGAKDGSFAEIALIGDGTHTKDISAFTQADSNGVTFDKTLNMVNIFNFYRMFGKVFWNIISQYNSGAPTLLSVATSTDGLTVSFTFSRAMANPSSQTGLFTFSPTKTIVSAGLRSGNTSIIDVVVSVAFATTDTITTTVGSGLNPADGGSVYGGVTGQAVTNSVSSGSTTAAIEALTGLQALWVAETSNDFSLTGSNINTWKDRSTNARHLIQSTAFRTFDSVNKKVTGSNVSANLVCANAINLASGNFTLIIYEKLTYIGSTDVMLGSNAIGNSYIGENNGSSMRIKMAGTDVFFAEGTLPNTVRKHVIRRLSSTSIEWKINGTVIDTPTIASGNTLVLDSLGLDGFNMLGDTYATIIFNTNLSDANVTIALNNLNTVLGV